VPQSSEQPLRSLHVGSDSAESFRTSLFVVDRHSVGLSRYACYRHRCYTSPGPLVWDVSLPIERLMAIFGEHPSHGCASESSRVGRERSAQRALQAAGQCSRADVPQLDPFTAQWVSHHPLSKIQPIDAHPHLYPK
jgi:hypothetical protein